MALPPQVPAAPPSPGVQITTFSGLKNTVAPESLTARELSRAQNIDLDDLGQAHRRRGRRKVASGRWHSIFTTLAGTTFGIKDGALVLVWRDYSTVVMMVGVSDEPLAWVEVGSFLYATSRTNSFRIELSSLQVLPWGLVTDHAYQPGLEPGPADWWYSPVVDPDTNPDSALGAVAGKLLGAPPLGAHACYFNGRVYVASGSVLWATELFLYDYVDKTAGFRQYEAEITGLCAVDDGMYVGTTAALYYVNGRYGEETRSLKAPAGVLPGSMRHVPGEEVDPEGRRFPDLPRQTSRAMGCVTHAGAVIGMNGGQTYNLTRNQFIFPRAESAATLMRQEDGMNTFVMSMKSGGTPTDGARFGDRADAVIIRAGTPGQPGSSGVGALAP